MTGVVGEKVEHLFDLSWERAWRRLKLRAARHVFASDRKGTGIRFGVTNKR